jgi:hypothetical protein
MDPEYCSHLNTQDSPEIKRKGAIYRQKQCLSVPDALELDRYRLVQISSIRSRRERPSSASSSPGMWTQRASPRARLDSAHRYGVPTRLLNLLASEAAGLGASPFDDPSERIAAIKSLASLPSSVQQRISRPSGIPLAARRTTDNQFLVQRKSQRPMSATQIGKGYPVEIIPVNGSRNADNSPPPRAPVATVTKAVDSQAHGAWSLSTTLQQQGPDEAAQSSSLPLTATSSSYQFPWETLEYGKEVMKWRDAVEPDRWHPGIPMPRGAKGSIEMPMPHAAIFEDNTYHRRYHRSLHAVAESLA